MLSIAGTLIGEIIGVTIAVGGFAAVVIIASACPDGCVGLEGPGSAVLAYAAIALGGPVGFAVGGPLGLYGMLRSYRQPCAGLTAWLAVSFQVGTMAAVTAVGADGRGIGKLEYLWLLLPMMALPLPLAARWAVTRGWPPGPVRVAPDRG